MMAYECSAACNSSLSYPPPPYSPPSGSPPPYPSPMAPSTSSSSVFQSFTTLFRHPRDDGTIHHTNQGDVQPPAPGPAEAPANANAKITELTFLTGKADEPASFQLFRQVPPSTITILVRSFAQLVLDPANGPSGLDHLRINTLVHHKFLFQSFQHEYVRLVVRNIQESTQLYLIVHRRGSDPDVKKNSMADDTISILSHTEHTNCENLPFVTTLEWDAGGGPPLLDALQICSLATRNHPEYHPLNYNCYHYAGVVAFALQYYRSEQRPQSSSGDVGKKKGRFVSKRVSSENLEDGTKIISQFFENKVQTLRLELLHARQHFDYALDSVHKRFIFHVDSGSTSGGFVSTLADEKGKQPVRGV